MAIQRKSSDSVHEENKDLDEIVERIINPQPATSVNMKHAYAIFFMIFLYFWYISYKNVIAALAEIPDVDPDLEDLENQQLQGRGQFLISLHTNIMGIIIKSGLAAMLIMIVFQIFQWLLSSLFVRRPNYTEVVERLDDASSIMTFSNLNVLIIDFFAIFVAYRIVTIYTGYYVANFIDLKEANESFEHAKSHVMAMYWVSFIMFWAIFFLFKRIVGLIT